MRDWRSALVSPDTTIFKAVETINNSSLQVALVVDDENRLVGMLTDGDVRRAILRNISLDNPVERIMSKEVTIATVRDSQESILSLMHEKDLRHIPILDDSGRIVDLKVLFEMVEPKCQRLDNWVVLMAGGTGSRLRPLTENSPKPLLKVGGRPVLETIIEKLRECGLYRFFISINYKANMIEEYFGDGSKWGVEISYLREVKELGTAGSLTLLPDPPSLPIVVMNSDLLTKVNFRQLLDFHMKNTAAATMCVREYDLRIPFGVVDVDGLCLTSLREKPVHRFFVNAGIYILEPEVLELIPKDRLFHMTMVFEKLLELGRSATIFPIHEYWLDIGRLGDYERANGEFFQHFE